MTQPKRTNWKYQFNQAIDQRNAAMRRAEEHALRASNLELELKKRYSPTAFFLLSFVIVLAGLGFGAAAGDHIRELRIKSALDFAHVYHGEGYSIVGFLSTPEEPAYATYFHRIESEDLKDRILGPDGQVFVPLAVPADEFLYAPTVPEGGLQ